MPIQVTVHPPESLAREPITLHLDADPVVIGRSPDADVHLDDPGRVVSKQHAEVRRSDDGYRVVDLGSKNFTYLDGVQLEPGRPYPIGSGETIQVGDFELTVRIPALSGTLEAADRADGYADETVFAADFQNPFEETVLELSDVLRDLAEAYDREARGRRDDALRDAVAQLDRDPSIPAGHPGIRRALSLLDPSYDRSPSHSQAPPPDGGLPEPPSQTSAPSPREAPSPSTGASSSTPSPPTAPSAPDDAEVPPFISPEAQPDMPNLSFGEPSVQDRQRDGTAREESGAAGVDDATQALVRAVSRLITLPWQFRHEFIGQTILQPPESAFLYDTPEILHRNLLGARVAPDERHRRLGYLQEAVDAVARHQIAMLDGYKASVTIGAAELLEDLDPGAHLQTAQETSVLHQWLPPLAAGTAIDLLRAQYEEMKHGTWSVAERRVFRPAFIKAYLARMTAA